jgi:hypothetical protein
LLLNNFDDVLADFEPGLKVIQCGHFLNHGVELAAGFHPDNPLVVLARFPGAGNSFEMPALSILERDLFL